MKSKTLSVILALSVIFSLIPGRALSAENASLSSDETPIIWERDAGSAGMSAAEGDAVALRIVPPDAKTVATGAALDIRGLEVYAAYQDGTEEAVTDYVLSGLDSSKPGEKEVTVTYETPTGETLTGAFSVTVEEEDYIAGIAPIVKPKKRTYAQGEPLEIDGLRVLVAYHLGKRVMVDGADCAVTGYNPNQLGVQTVIVSYGGKSAEFLVKVVPGNGQPEPENIPALMAPRIEIESVQGGKIVRFTRKNNEDSNFASQYPGQSAKIYYTLDGSAPVPGEPETFEYTTDGVTLEDTVTVKAVAILGDEFSAVASGRVSVPQTQRPTPANPHHKNNQGPDGGMTELSPGTLVSLLCDTSGASVYYWFEGQASSAENHRYGSSVYVDSSVADDEGKVVLHAYATKDGYKNSDIMTLRYRVPVEEPPAAELVNVSAGTVRSRAGEAASASLSITTEESSRVTGFTITIRYDRRNFSFESVSPVETGGAQSETVIPAGELFAAPDPAAGLVRVMYNGGPVSGGEMCTLNFRSMDSAEDKSYDLTVDEESATVKTSSGRPVEKKTYDGAITLEGSHNSQLTASVLFSGDDSRDVSSASELAGSSQVTASISIDRESVEEYTDALTRENGGDAPLTVTANAFVAFYGEDTHMLSLEAWEIDLSDLTRLFFERMADMPDEAVEIKIIILSETLTPIMAPGELSDA